MQVQIDYSKLIDILKDYFSKNQEVAFAFLFGSYANGKFCKESDIDIAVYLKYEDSNIENKLWQDLEHILKKEVELLILNRAKPLVSWQIIRKGIPLGIRNRKIFLDFVLEVSNEAEDLLDFNLDAFRRKEAIFGEAG